MYRALRIFGALLVLILRSSGAFAQSEIPIECGDVYPGELVDQQPQRYQLQLIPGTVISLRVEPIGSGFNPHLLLKDKIGNIITTQNANIEGEMEEITDYVVATTNPTLVISGDRSGSRYTGRQDSNTSLGAYTIYLDCVGVPTPLPIPTQSSSGFGPPPLPPQDFAVGVTLPLQAGIANPGTISAGFQGIFGYTFEASAGNTVDLSFVRQSGNLSLGLAVVGADNTTVFQTSLIGTTSLNATFPIPVSQTYTIGVYVINIGAPASPENTGFTIQAAVD